MASITLTPPFSDSLQGLNSATKYLDRRSHDFSELNARLNDHSGGTDLAHALAELGALIRNQITTEGFTQIRGIPSLRAPGTFIALCSAVGTLFDDLAYEKSIALQATPRPSAILQANKTSRLPLHTDFAMLENPPTVTAIWCRKEDPGGPSFGRNGLCSATDVVSSVYGTPLMERLENVRFPFAGTRGTDEVFEHYGPILVPSRSPGRLSQVRFHPSRIYFGDRVSDSSLGSSEFQLMHDFRELCLHHRREVYLKQGDVLFINNRSMLHDRTECSLTWDGQEFASRVSEIAFIQTLGESRSGESAP